LDVDSRSVESANDLWSQAALVAAAGGIGGLVLVLIPTINHTWPWELSVVLGGAMGLVVLARTQWPPDPVARRQALYGALASIGLCALGSCAPMLVPAWPWWAPGLGAILGAGLAFAWGAPWLVRDHRSLKSRLVYALELAASADLDGDGLVGDPHQPSRIMLQKPAGPVNLPASAVRELESAAPEEGRIHPARDIDAYDYYDRMDFGTFVGGIWPLQDETHHQIYWGTAFLNWNGRPLPSGARMTQGKWEKYCSRLVEAGLIRKADARSNAGYILRATREEAIACLRDLIILPEELSEPAIVQD